MKKILFNLFVGALFLPTISYAGTATTYFGAGGGSITISSSTITPIVLTTHTAFGSPDSNTVTSPATNTTGANFLAIAVAYYEPDVAPVLTDSKSNVWTKKNVYNGNNFNTLTIYYSSNPIVGTSHTFTLTNNGTYTAGAMAAFANVKTSTDPFDQQNGANNVSATTLQSGAATPGSDNELILSGFSIASPGTMSVNSGFTITDQVNDTVNNVGVALAYIINGSGTSGVAVNPTWTNSGSAAQVTANIATFKVGP